MHRRADPGRGRHQPAAARLPAGAAAHLHRHRHGADLRRDPDRRRPHRHLLRVRERGRGPRRRDAGQGAGGRHADRRHAGERGGRRAASSRARTPRPSAATRSPPPPRSTCSGRSTSSSLLEHCREVGAHLGSSLLRLAERRRPKTRGARGRGPPAGARSSTATPATSWSRARAHGLLLSVAGGNVVRFVPPLVVSKAEIDEAVEILDAVLGGVRDERDAGRPSDSCRFDDLPAGGIEALIRRAEELRALRAAAHAARHASRPRAGHGVREGLDAHARQLRDRHVRARRPRALPRPRRARSSGAASRSRDTARVLVRLLPRHHDPHLRPRPRRGDGALRAGAGHQRPHRSAAPLPGAGRSADRRAAVRRRPALEPRRCARSATPGSATATTWPTPGSRRPASSASTWRSPARPGYDPDAGVLGARARRRAAGASRVVRDPAEAAAGRQVISTDVFASMGAGGRGRGAPARPSPASPSTTR